MKLVTMISEFQFVQELLKLFKYKNDTCFIGSMDDARILLMTKINRFIDKKYIYSAFGILKDKGVFYEKGESLKGKRLYYIDFTLGQKEIEKISKKFMDFYDNICELTSEADLFELRELEKEKNIRLVKEGYIVKLTNEGKCLEDEKILWDLPRTEVLKFIEQLRSYPPVTKHKPMNCHLTKRNMVEFLPDKVKLSQRTNNQLAALITAKDYEVITRPEELEDEQIKIFYSTYIFQSNINAHVHII